MSAPENPDDILLNVSPDSKPGRFVVVASHAGSDLNRNAFELNSRFSRDRFVRDVLQALFPEGAEEEVLDSLRRNLDGRLLAFAAVPPGETASASPIDSAPEDPRIAALAEMPDDVRLEAEAFLADPKLLERIIEDIKRQGVVGERRNALTIYIAGVSAQLPKPLSIIARGSSSSGKSYMISRIADLFPPEVVLNATSLTTNALYYFPPGSLRHRFVVAGERSRAEDDNAAEATRALREMIEAGRLTKAVPMKQNDRIVTEVIEQQGPIAFIESTTLGNIFTEDANRCLMISTDECEDQTRRILEATAAVAAGHRHPNLDRLRAVHHALQRMLPRCDVIIPFAEHISALYPTNRLDARRSFRHLLVLVKASALLHHRQRERDAAGNVVAMIEDYSVAEKLGRAPLSAAASGLTDGARNFLQVLRTIHGDREFSTADAQNEGKGSRRARYTWLHELESVGAVEQKEASRGKVPARWILTGIDPAVGMAVLPTAAEVSNRLSASTHARDT
jgi:hypothetical protein